MRKLPRVLIHNDETDVFSEKLSEAFSGIPYCVCRTYEELPSMIANFKPEVLFSVRFNGTLGFPRDAIFQSNSLEWVANGGAGTDHFGTWDPDAITVTNSAGVAADMMAEYIMGGFLHFTLDISGLQNDKAERVWNVRTVRPLQGQTLLIVGLGNTGRALAKRAHAFGMNVIGTRANPQPTENVDQVAAASELHDLLPNADFLAICTPLTHDTRNLLDQSAFAAMKDKVIIADVSRGHVVNQKALIDSLRKGKVGGAILDVFEEEPLPKKNPIWNIENVVVSPHCSSLYEGWEEASFGLFLQNLSCWINQNRLQNVVDPYRGY